MRIGIDIDGVLTKIQDFQFEYGSKYFYEKYGAKIVDSNAYYSKDLFNVSLEEDILFWQKHFRKYMMEDSPRVFASEVINKLKEQGNEIYIITARIEDCDNFCISNSEMIEMTKNWLLKNNIFYDDIIWTVGSKLPYCIDKKIDVMIEDNSLNVREISSKINVLCFDNKYNEDVCGNNITRVYSWYDIYSKINIMVGECDGN